MPSRLIFLVLFPFLASCSSPYYWREYTGGEIPKDAVIGGQNQNGENVYIAQVYAELKRIVVAELREGEKSVAAILPKWVARVERNIKILCGLQKNFVWIVRNGTGMKATVSGGHIDNKAVLIGRVIRNNSIQIGSIYDSRLHWIDQMSEKSETIYEVLTYDPTISQAYKKSYGYYWREYNGTIPDDAIIGGKDINRKNLFIGQADTGSDLTVVRIFPGVTEVEGSQTGNKITNHVKILCGQAFWKPVTVENLHLALIRNEAVIGGHKKNEGYLAVGRVSYENEVKIGQIPFYSYTRSMMYFSDRSYVKLGFSYEILIAKVYNFQIK